MGKTFRLFAAIALISLIVTGIAQAEYSGPGGNSGGSTPGGSTGSVQYSTGSALGGVTIPAGNLLVGTGTTTPPAAASAASVLATLNGVKAWPTKRVPAITDDTNSGYAVNSFWNYNGNEYVNLLNTAGRSVWQPLQIQPAHQLILDAVPGALGAYGVFKMRAAYAGNAFLIQRTSDNTQLGIGFDTDGTADWKTADNFCVGTTCGVVTWYDQSGNGYDLTTNASFAASISGTTMTVTAISSGVIASGQTLSGAGVTGGTTITGLEGSHLQASISGTVLTVNATFAGTVHVGQTVFGPSVTAGTTITSLGTGTGGSGTYNLSASSSVGLTNSMWAQQFPLGTGQFSVSASQTVASETMSTARTVANLPQIMYGNSAGTNRSISFSGAVNSPLINAIAPITNTQAMSVLTIFRPSTSQVSGAFWEIGWPGPNGFSNYTHYNNTGNGLNNWSTASISSPQVQLLISNGATNTNSFVIQNNRKNTAYGALNSGAQTGYQFGDGLGDTSYPGSQEALGWVVYNGVLSAVNQNLLLQSAFSNTNIQPQANDVFAQAGDSITAGTVSTSGAPEDEVWATMIQKNLDHPFNFYNLGHAGQTACGMVSEQGPFGSILYQAGANNIVTILAGTNDMAAGTTPAATLTCVQNIAAAYKTAGFKVVVVTMLPRCAGFSGGVTNSSFETNRQTFNASMLSGYTAYADAVADPGNDPVIGVASTYCTSPYSGDSIHPSSPLGYSILAADIAKGVAPLIQ